MSVYDDGWPGTFHFGGGHHAGKRWRQGGMDITEQLLRRELARRRLILSDEEYRQSGVEVEPGTFKLIWR